MLNVSDTLWALSEIFGDRQDIKDGVSFVILMFFGIVTVMWMWA